ncbi:ATP-dependent DNA helicase DDX31-like [Amphiura filiformis]|uniref:ATP-dependent DNA helicase DDX31-like n=1 Tax=Amphiura filiformis TaxID=82378 RepID=UPI003B220A79
MDADDSQIVLNLDTSSSTSSGHRSQTKANQSRKEETTQSPWKQRKKRSFDNKQQRDGGSEDKDATNSERRSSQQRGHRSSSHPGRSGTGGSGIISSMFRNNPEIPEVNVREVESGKEPVFSSKAFSALPLHPHMIANLEQNLQFSQMTSVQQQAIPVVLSGQDTLVKSQTGTGKTLAYGVPIVQSLQGQRSKVQRSDGPYALVLVPTRELALQSLDMLQKLLKPYQWIVAGCVMGGERKKSEKARIRRGINILVATPGRIVDHIENTKNMVLRNVRYLVLDEADRLLDMGFDREVAVILNALNEQAPERQTILLSATLTDDVKRLAGIALKEPKLIDIAQDSSSTTTIKHVRKSECTGEDSTKDQKKTRNTVAVDAESKSELSDSDGGVGLESMELKQSDFTTPEGLQQHFVIVPSKLRLVTLTAFILWRCTGSGSGKMLVFLSSCDSVEFHYALIQHCLKVSSYEDRLHVYRLHGNMAQEDRTDVFKNFSEARSGVLLCTDVAARGLDLPKVKWIVQYNTPGQPSDYVHRVGRTARIGKKGHALLFLSPSEVDYVQVLIGLKIRLTQLPLEDIWSTLLSSPVPAMLAEQSRRRDPNTNEDAAIALQHSCENFVLESKENLALAKKAFQSFIRSYATYPSSLKHIFHVKKLHLGHVAKSFALREAPSHMGTVGGKSGQKGIKRKRPGRDKMSKSSGSRKGKSGISEYSSGLDTGSLVTAKKRKMMPSIVGNKKKKKGSKGKFKKK